MSRHRLTEVLWEFDEKIKVVERMALHLTVAESLVFIFIVRRYLEDREFEMFFKSRSYQRV